MKIRFGLVLMLALGFGLTGCASGGGSSSGGTTGPSMIPGAETLAQGERPRDDENTRAAQRALEDAADAESEAAAETLYRQGLQAAEMAIAADSTNPRAWRLAAEASMGAGDYIEADRFMDRAEELRPIYTFETESIREQAWIGLYQEAVPLVNAGDYDAAAEIFEQANAIYDQRPEVMITLGQIYGQLRRHDEALENLAAAEAVIASDVIMEMDSATVASWQEQGEGIPLMRAQILADAGRTEEAVAAYRAVVAENPDNMQYRRDLATLLVQMGDEEAAFEVYDDLMAAGGLSANDYYAIGVGFYQGSAYDRAAEAFAGAVEVSPMDRDALEMWVRSLQIDSAYAAIPPVAERWTELDPNNQNAWLILAQAQQRNGNTAAAGDAVRQIEALTVTMDNMQMRRFSNGGAQVSASLMNKSLAQGASINIRFTFYDMDGNQMGTAQHTMTAPAQETTESFQVEFSSTEQVGGYSYEIS